MTGETVRLKCTLSLILLLGVRTEAGSSQSEKCNPPQDLQHEIATKYRGWKIATLADLDEDDRGFFQKDHGDACPGLVSVDFYGDAKPTLAMVLITNDKSELIVAHQVAGLWKTAVLGTGGPSVPVVWALPPGKYSDVYGRKAIQATRSVIVFFRYESWGILYAWSGNAVSKIWIAD